MNFLEKIIYFLTKFLIKYLIHYIFNIKFQIILTCFLYKRELQYLNLKLSMPLF
jgi:hypothetical protein